MHRLVWGPLVLSLACGGTEAPPPAPAPARVSPVPTEAARPTAPPARGEPSSALELVQRLRELANGSTPDRIDAYVDHDFAERLPSGDDLADLFRGWPEGCEAQYDESEGYAYVAIPPPMEDDPPEEVTRIEGLIAELQASTEVSAMCDVVEVYQDEADDPPTPHVRSRMLFAVAARRDSAGRWRAIAWRGFSDDDSMRD